MGGGGDGTPAFAIDVRSHLPQNEHEPGRIQEEGSRRECNIMKKVIVAMLVAFVIATAAAVSVSAQDSIECMDTCTAEVHSTCGEMSVDPVCKCAYWQCMEGCLGMRLDSGWPAGCPHR